jgi:Flp pilus assembly pilin Flp
MVFRSSFISGAKYRVSVKQQTKGEVKMLALYGRCLKVKDAIQRRLTDEEGQGLVEYVLIIVLIALVVLGTIPPIANALKNGFNAIESAIASGVSAS